MATCAAFYAGRYLHRHGLPRRGLRVRTEFTMASDRPARVDTVRLVIVPPPALSATRPCSPSPRTARSTAHCAAHPRSTSSWSREHIRASGSRTGRPMKETLRVPSRWRAAAVPTPIPATPPGPTGAPAC
ncbi:MULTISPECIES: hypothetical protein [unclassified Streptomyces]|uniref:hypothetical protein n=1 Tax=unclassified Streptomyces TaxID=2593676 RepID=UPI0036E28F7F